MCGATGKDGHSANYKGCPVYQARLKPMQSKKRNAVALRVQEKPRSSAKVVTPDQLYAQIATTKPSTTSTTGTTKTATEQLPQQKQLTEESTIADVMTVLTNFQTSMDKMNPNINQLNQRARVLDSSKSPQQEPKKRKK